MVETNSTGLATIDVKPATPPEGLTESQIKDINAHAQKSVDTLLTTKGSEMMTASEQITNVGIQDQKTISNGIALLQEKMGGIFYSKDKSNVTDNMSKDITELQNVLAKINPTDIQKEGRYRLIRIIPFFGDKIVNILKESSNKGMTLQQFVEHLDESLKTGETMLRQDNAQLKVMYQDLEGKQKLINADAYFAEVLMEKLSDAIATTTDEKVKNNLNKILFKVATRAQDLRAMNNIHEQFFVSIEMARDNNDLLIDGARRMITMGMNVVYVSMAIHTALIRAKNVKDVEVGTGEFIGKMLVSNATIINGMVTEIGDLYKRPFVSMEMMEKAVAQLEQAIDSTNKLKAEGIERAKENIVKIKIMTDEIKNKSGQLPDSDIKSLEASKTLLLDSGK
jgi:uncharacterized protein YaaN involved in tellurite resistance